MKTTQTLVMGVALAALHSTQAANINMTANDANGATTSFNGAGSWSPAGVPTAGNGYFNNTFLLRTPAATGNFTFAGDSLTITGTPAYNSNQALLYKGTANSTITINNLTIDGGNLRSASGDPITATFTGNLLTVGANGMGVQVQGPTIVAAPIAGSSFIRVFNSESSSNTRLFRIASSANTFTGNLELVDANNSRVQLDTGANFVFAIGASGTNNRISGNGHLFLNGYFDLDLANAGTTIGDTWTLVTTSTLTETYGSTFSITGFTSDGGTAGSRIWTGVVEGVYYQFREATGILSVINPDSDGDGLDDGWELANFGNLDYDGSDDPDSDGVSNQEEEAAGTDPNDPNSWPDVDEDGLKDAWEIQYFGNIAAQTGSQDPDGDLATNLEEFQAGTNPTRGDSWPDSDGDQMNDAWEWLYFGTLAHDGSADTDGDGFTDLAEHDAHTNPSATDGLYDSPVWANLRHRWSFNGDLNDSVGTSHASIVEVGANNVFFNDISNPNGIVIAGGDKASSDYVRLGSNLIPDITTPITIELWAKQNTVQNWSRIFDFHSSTDEYVMMSWTTGTNNATDRVEFRDTLTTASGSAPTSFLVDNANQPYGTAQEHHIVMVLQPLAGTNGQTKVTVYSAPTSAASLGAPKITGETYLNLVNFTDTLNALGYSPWPDNTASATYNEVRIWNGALRGYQLEKLHTQGPDQPIVADTDQDNMPDDWEIQYFGALGVSQDGNDDTDGDTFSNLAELAAGSNPNLAASTPLDLDADGLADAWEIQYFGNTTAQDGSGDPDNDGIDNLTEQANGTDPTSQDNDGDGLSDVWETTYFGTPTAYIGTDDPDGDGFNNEAEETAGSDPTDPASTPLDLDADGLADAWEIQHFGSTATYTGADDPDNDGYSNEAEETAGSIPNNAASTPVDINADGIPDGHKLVATDLVGTSSFNSGLHWDDGQAPVAGNNYLVPSGDLRTPADDNPYTFAGDRLVLATGSRLVVKGGGLITVPYLGLDGTNINNAANSNLAIRLTGNEIRVTRSSELFANNNSIYIEAPVTGTGELVLTRTGTVNAVEFRANNTWTGNLTVTGGFVLGSTGTLKFAPTTAGTTNSVGGAGVAQFYGAFSIDTSAAATDVGATWTLVNAATLTETYDSSFHVNGFTANAATPGQRVWTSNDGAFTFQETTGVLTRTSSGGNDSDGDGIPDSWETTYFGNLDQPANGDFDHDGTDNLTEYRLGLIPNDPTSRFAVSRSASGLLTWTSANGLSFTVERSVNLGTWQDIETITATGASSTYTDPNPPAGKAFYRIRLNP